MSRGFRRTLSEVAANVEYYLGGLRPAIEKPYTRVYYIVEGAGWSIDVDGAYICRGARRAGIDARPVRRWASQRQQVLHFGSRNAILAGARYAQIHSSNKVLFTWFHGSPDDPNPVNQSFIKAVPEAAERAARVIASCSIGAARLREFGVAREKIVTIPLGVDTQLFRPATSRSRAAVRRDLKIPEGAVCVGSFQKDGVGWGDGLEPKLVKGPDLLVETLMRLHKEHPLFVLLSGPGRGYVKQALRRAEIPFRHLAFKDYRAVAALYHALDLYIISSRDEGGPKALLESMASGVPVVATRVGMVPDVLRPGYNGASVEVGDVEGLVQEAADILSDRSRHTRLADGGLHTIRTYDWGSIAHRYVVEVYTPLLNSQFTRRDFVDGSR